MHYSPIYKILSQVAKANGKIKIEIGLVKRR